MKPNINWIIHLVMNGVQCVECGDVENSFMPYTCNCHTHGMEQYGHPDFQVVINYPNEEIGRILNTLGLRVQAGEKFKDGDYVTGIYEDCSVRMKEFVECNRKVLRVIIPDKHNRFPEDKHCMEDEYFIEWNKTITILSPLIQKGIAKLKIHDMNQIINLIFIKLYVDYDLEEDFFPQFIANRDMMIKLMNDLPIHGGE